MIKPVSYFRFNLLTPLTNEMRPAIEKIHHGHWRVVKLGLHVGDLNSLRKYQIRKDFVREPREDCLSTIAIYC